MNYTEEYTKQEGNKNFKGIFIGIGILTLALIGSTYAFFTYSKTLQAFTLTSGSITASFEGGSNQINITNGYPISDQFAIQNLDKLDYIDFTVSGNIEEENKGLTYEIYLTEKDSNTLDPNYIKVYITDENGQKIYIMDETGKNEFEPKIYNSLENTTYSKDASTGKVIYKLEGIPSNYSKSFRIYAWIDKDYEQNEVQEEFSFYVNLYAYNDKIKTLYGNIKKNLTTTNNVPDNYVLEDEIYYISGCKEDGDSSVCNEKNTIDFNYVWYSGKLWRVTALYSDGRIKMITDKSITSIDTGCGNYAGSWGYQWLNEDFKDTLYNYQDIIDVNYSWNATMTSAVTKPAESTMVSAPVGSLNTYEYVESYSKLGAYDTELAYSNSYLNIGNRWWLISPYNSSNNRVVRTEGNLENFSCEGLTVSIRPSIVIKSEITVSDGDGSKSNPYKIKGDMASPIVNTTLLNSRVSGEYVIFKNELYRIVDIDFDNTTKIVKEDYVRYESGNIVTKYFASSVSFGNSFNTKTDSYWDYYLNNTWLKNIFGIDSNNSNPDDIYNTILEKGTYYLGGYNSSLSYKNTLCRTSNTTETVKNCEKKPNADKKFIGYVGLLRIGEMFASRFEREKEASRTWLITPVWIVTSNVLSSSNVFTITQYGFFQSSSYGTQFAVHPTLNIKSSIVIKGGDGTFEHPFIIE